MEKSSKPSKSSKSSSTALTVPDVDGFALNQQNQLIHPDPNTYQAFGTYISEQEKTANT